MLFGNTLGRACDEMECRRPPLPMRIATIPRSGGARTKVRGAGKQSEAPLHSIDETLVLTPFGRIQCTARRRNRGHSPLVPFPEFDSSISSWLRFPSISRYVCICQQSAHFRSKYSVELTHENCLDDCLFRCDDRAGAAISQT